MPQKADKEHRKSQQAKEKSLHHFRSHIEITLRARFIGTHHYRVDGAEQAN